MKKVGIITYYYHSNNYGGNLQSYALASYINKLSGFKAEQICFDFLHSQKQYNSDSIGICLNQNKNTTSKKTITFIRKILIFLGKLVSLATYKRAIIRFLNIINSNKFYLRECAILRFNTDLIPHSSMVYTSSNIIECNDAYDIFITGSDQVWSVPSNEFMLGFVDKKNKVSYAASIARTDVTESHRLFIKDKIKLFNNISVRDNSDKDIVSKLTDLPVEVVLDPVFLLEKKEWDTISGHNRFSDVKYVFCYFLGESKKFNKIIKNFAKKNNLKIVIVPNFKNNENSTSFSDLFFGNYKPYDISPSDFLTLIREAEYVFTDSFHALAFSLIYNKNFFVIDRISKWGKMNSRITNLLEKVGLSDRFCNNKDKENVEYISRMKPINYSEINDLLEKEKQKSCDFLKNSLYGSR